MLKCRGKTELMMSFTKEEQVPWEMISDRDARFGVETGRKREVRRGIEEVGVNDDADGCWKRRCRFGHRVS